MNILRQRLSWVVRGSLCCQFLVLTVTPASLCANAAHASDAMDCTCVPGADAQCPMHHPVKSTPGCECRSTTDGDVAALVSLLGPVAVVASSSSHTVALSPSAHMARSIPPFANWIAVPDGPPPRA